MAEYIIYSNKYSLQERYTKSGERLLDIYFRIEENGKTRQKKISGSKNKAEAKRRYNDFVAKHCEFRRERPRKEEKPTEQEITVGDAFAKYSAWLKANSKPSTAYDKQKIYDKFVAPKFASAKLTELTKSELSFWQDEVSLTKKNDGNLISYSTSKKIKKYFSAFLEWCEDRYGITNNLRAVKSPKRHEPKKEMEFWTREEFQQFIDVVDDELWKTFFTVLFFTGRRRGEVMALNPKDVNFRKQTISFTKSVTRKTGDSSIKYEIVTPKANKQQILPVATPVLDCLKDFNYNSDAQFIFGGSSPLAPTTVSREFNKYIQKAGVKRIRLHDLRHSFVSMLIHNGTNLTVVADLIGDTLEQITKTYAHMYTEDREKAISMLK